MTDGPAQRAMERTMRRCPWYALIFNTQSGPLGNIESMPNKRQCVPNQDEGVSVCEHTLFIDGTSVDALYHFRAFYQLDLLFEAV